MTVLCDSHSHHLIWYTLVKGMGNKKINTEKKFKKIEKFKSTFKLQKLAQLTMEFHVNETNVVKIKKKTFCVMNHIFIALNQVMSVMVK